MQGRYGTAEFPSVEATVLAVDIPNTAYPVAYYTRDGAVRSATIEGKEHSWENSKADLVPLLEEPE